MAVTFESATIVVEADAAVDYVNLGFDGATHLPNDGKAHGPLSGISSQALVFYTSGETHPPKTFYAAKPEVVFSSDTVHLTGKSLLYLVADIGVNDG